MNELEQLRQEIEKIDEQWLQIIAKRFEITQKVGEYKKEHNLPAGDAVRETKLYDRIAMLAKEINLDPYLARDILKKIIEKAKENHKKIKES